jgi:hypothetical protein
MDEASVALPLSRGERQRIYSLLLTSGDEGAALAERLAADWELDPTTRVLLLQLDTLSDELRTLRWWVLGVVVLAMTIQAGLVGLSLSLEVPGASIDVSPGALEASDDDDGIDP